MSAAWTVSSGPEVVVPLGDHQRFLYVLSKGEDHREVFVEIAGTAAASQPAGLPAPIDDAVASHGRSVLERQLDRAEPVTKVIITTMSVRSVPRLGWYETGDRLAVREGDEWVPCEFLEPGEPADAESIKDERLVSGSHDRDVAWVRILSSGQVISRRYELLRPEAPPA